MDERAAEGLKERVAEAVEEKRALLLELSHEIHANPELAFEEHKAAALLTAALAREGLRPEAPAYGLDTAFAAEFGRDGGPLVALCAEYDALPEIGHACGHNLIAASSVGAAFALRSLGDALPGRVRLLGTPAEEGGAGKEIMARKGAFDGAGAAMMVHPSGLNLATMPAICVANVRVSYEGRAAHAAAMPERGVNALDALVTAYQAIAQLRQHIKASERIHGIITEGGTAPNVVPERSAGRFLVRAGNARDLDLLKPRVEGCFEAGAKATGARLTLEWGEIDYLDMKTNWPLAERFQKNAEALGREFYPHERIGQRGAGSTDMGNVSYRVPSIHPMLACAPRTVTIHHPEFAKWARSEDGDRLVLDAAKALAMTALDFFIDDGLRARVAENFQTGREIGAAEAAAS